MTGALRRRPKLATDDITIVHFDLDAFFAAVEVLLDPSLAGRPVIVGADPGGRGVVATASYEARAFGVHSAMPIGQAYRACPDGVFLRPRHAVYGDYSRRVFDVARRFSPQVQPLSVDEGFVALDGNHAVTTTREMKAAIRQEVGLVASVGIATSKLVSKIASGQGKPDGFVVVPPGGEAAFLAPLPIRELWGVGPKTGQRLAALGITSIGDLAAVPLCRLTEAFGRRYAEDLARHALGIGDRTLHVERTIKSVSDEHTFQHDESDGRALWAVLGEQCDHLASRLRRHDLIARTVTVKLRYADFQTVTRGLSLDQPSDDPAVLREAVVALMRRYWSGDRRRLRLVGVKLSGLVPARARQPRLL